MKVLIACERFGVIRDTFIRAGHDAWSCDLVPTEVPGPHIQGSALDILDQGWDLMIAHPDCTYLTVAAAWALKDPNFEKYPGVGYHMKVKEGTLTGEARRKAQQDALWFVEQLAKAPIHRIAIENPAVGAINKNVNLKQYGFASNFPTQIIHPYQFGHDASKATGLALKNLPKLEHTLFIEPRIVAGKERWANQTDSGQNRLSPSTSRAMERAKTYQGWADAMVSQWGSL